jgi:hypothetical protein
VASRVMVRSAAAMLVWPVWRNALMARLRRLDAVHGLADHVLDAGQAGGHRLAERAPLDHQVRCQGCSGSRQPPASSGTAISASTRAWSAQ